MSNYYAQMPQGQYYPEGQGQPGPQPPMGYPPQGGMPQGMPMGQPYPAQPYPPQPTQVSAPGPGGPGAAAAVQVHLPPVTVKQRTWRNKLCCCTCAQFHFD